MPRSEPRPAVVVTGATNGIGRAMATAAAAQRRPIVLIGRSEERLRAVAAEVGEQGGEAFPLILDLLADDAAAQVQAFLAGHALVCDVLVNSAGNGLQGLAASQPVGAQLDMIDLNVRVLVELTLALTPSMVARGSGGVINLSSVASLVPGPRMAVYYATKSFVSSFSQALYEELRGTGVTVTCVLPGPVETGFLEGRGIKQARLFTSLPELTPEQVADSAWRGFSQGRRLVVPGIASRAAAAVTRFLPLRLLLPAINALQERGSDRCPCGSGKKFRHCHGGRKTTP